jgi:hypothetical protein
MTVAHGGNIKQAGGGHAIQPQKRQDMAGGSRIPIKKRALLRPLSIPRH